MSDFSVTFRKNILKNTNLPRILRRPQEGMSPHAQKRLHTKKNLGILVVGRKVK